MMYELAGVNNIKIDNNNIYSFDFISNDITAYFPNLYLMSIKGNDFTFKSIEDINNNFDGLIIFTVTDNHINYLSKCYTDMKGEYTSEFNFHYSNIDISALFNEIRSNYYQYLCNPNNSIGKLYQYDLIKEKNKCINNELKSYYKVFKKLSEYRLILKNI